MNPWPFVIAAYSLTVVATLSLVWASYGAMRRDEAAAAAASRPDAGEGA